MPARPHFLDWILFATATFLWALAFPLNRVAVSRDTPELGLPPEWVIPGRLTLGGLILLIIALASRQKWPPISDWRAWVAMVLMGTVGTAAPFFAITHAQQTIDSSLAALYVAAAPLFVAVIAHFMFHDDRLSWQKSLGLAVGFIGVGVLFGPGAISSFGSASVAAQALCLMAAFFYGLSTIIARYAREVPSLVFAAGFVCIGAITTWPMAFTVSPADITPSTAALAGVVGLGLASTAAASIIYMTLIARTSATFLSLTGYSIPIVSALMGFIAFGEVQSWNALVAFVLILGGIYISQRTSRSVIPD